jgi:hypothetical protein
MSYFIVDVEANSTSPASGSMVSLGAIKVTPELDSTFYGKFKPIVNTYSPEALAISGFSFEETQKFDDPEQTMIKFAQWINETNTHGRPIFCSDNLAFDWMWICYYFDKYNISNPFGWSGRRIGDIICGFHNDLHMKWKHWRKTKHDHNPVNDAKGNAEVLLYMESLGLKIKLK